MVLAAIDTISLLPQLVHLGAFFPELPLDGLLSTQGIMVMLLAAYAGAMWMFLTSAPKVHTVMVSDLDTARQFYEGLLDLPVAEVPLHYYYNYEQTLGATAIDPLYLSPTLGGSTATQKLNGSEGLWYQLKKNNQRHVCFDRDCLEQVLMRVQMRRLKYKVRSEKPLNFLVKDLDGQVIELAEVSN